VVHAVHGLNGINAKGRIFGADGVLQIHSALVSPFLDRVHIGELKDYDAVFRRLAD
jgi:hypothetical protein